MNPSEIDLRTAQRALWQSLRDWRSAGLSHLPRVPTATEQSPARASVPSEPEALAPFRPSSINEPSARQTTSSRPDLEPSKSSIMTRDQRARQLADLAEQVSQCTRCQELAAARTQTVFGVGDPEAQVMFIGEAPGADEDRLGEPFVGRAGQLLTKIIEACGWKREEIYICNILRCRPPGNRNPTQEEAANCREYLDGQIAIVQPDYIVCWGSVAAKNLLEADEPIGRMRQRWFRYGSAKVLCTYHPSYLLRNPSAKKPVWEDMKLLLAEMGQKPPI